MCLATQKRLQFSLALDNTTITLHGLLASIRRRRRKVEFEVQLVSSGFFFIQPLHEHQRCASTPQIALWTTEHQNSLANRFLFYNAELAIMGISRDSRHKRAATGAKRAYYSA